MTSNFSFVRTCSLTKAYVVEHRKSLLLRSILMVAAMILAAVVSNLTTYPSSFSQIHNVWYKERDMCLDSTIIMMMVMLFGFVCISASYVFETMKRKELRISTLMMPVSQIEKYLSRMMVFFVGFLLVFALGVVLVDLIRVFVLPYFVNDEVCIRSFFSRQAYDMIRPEYDREPNLFILFPVLFLAVQSIFVLGSAISPKNAFVKTFCAGFIIVVLYISASAYWGMFLDSIISADGPVCYVNAINRENLELIIEVALFLFALLNWTLAYLRFKESEVIERW